MLKTKLKKKKRTDGTEVKKKRLSSKSAEIRILGTCSDKDEEERNLENIVFGTENDIIDKLTETSPHSKMVRQEGFIIDTVCAEDSTKRAAWVDDHDTTQTLSKSIQEPKWAELRKHIGDSDESDDDILKKTGNLLHKCSTLTRGILDIQKCTDLNNEFSDNMLIKATEFHPSAQVAMVAGYNGTATLFQVDGVTNAKIQSIHFEKFPIHTAHFTREGEQIVVGSKEYGFFYYYDMFAGKTVKVPCEKGIDQNNMRRFIMSPDGKFIVVYGRFGNIHLLSAQSKEWISTLKMNGEVHALAFNKDGSKLFSHGDTGQMFVWDINTRLCIHKFYDQGCVLGSAVAVSPNNKYLVAGSDSGVVNVYLTADLLSTSDPSPIKTIMNITTEVTGLKFNCTSEILAITSFHKQNAIKLVHFPTITTFSNFPTREKQLRYPHSLDISLNSGFLTMGNNSGCAYLFRLKHYHNY